MFQETCDKISKQEKEELRKLRETYHKKQHKILLDSSANSLKVSQETDNQFFNRQEDRLKQLREYLK